MQSADTITSRSRAGAVLSDLRDDDRGAVFLEFVIVLYAWFFLLFGVMQIGLIAIAAFYVNYGNFMALRAVSVQYEDMEYGWIKDKAALCEVGEKAALKAMGPLERYYWVNESKGFGFGGAKASALKRIDWDYVTTSQKTPDGKPMYIRGQLKYEFPLIIPFANYVIAGLMKNKTPQDETRVMQNFVFHIPDSGKYPTLLMQSRNDFDEDLRHQMLIQRRWRYN